ncbi:MAG: DUF3048 domain-containing protein [Anaerolineae bacterium]
MLLSQHLRKRSLTICAIVTLGILFAGLTGCSSDPTPVATPTATRTPIPTHTDTPDTPTATATPRATRTPRASATPASLAPTPFPPDVNPLTGLKVEDEALLDQIPVAIKVSNSPEVRPQSGLNAADLVFEHFAEGGITRFTAVFYGQEPETVGSVRSGRLIDLEVPAMYHALFGYSGSSAGVKNRIRNSDLFPDYIAAPDFGVGTPYFYRVPQAGKAFEHTLFTNPEVLRDLAEERGINERPEFPTLMAFSDEAPAGGEPVSYFEVNYLPGSCTAEWTYDEEAGVWGRATAGRTHTDALTGEQVTAANVIIVYANHLYTDILEDTWGGGHWSIEIQTWGQGPALIFRDGQMYAGIWKRTERDHMLTYYYGDETPLPLKPGNSWVQLVPLDTDSTEIGEGEYEFKPPKM